MILLAFSDLQYSLYLKDADTHTCYSDSSSEHEIFTNADKFWATGYTVNACKNTMFVGNLLSMFSGTIQLHYQHMIFISDSVSCR